MIVSVCDNRSVGVLISDHAGRFLMFDRVTFPAGVAGAAGHLDGHGSWEDAARAEVAEELGLTVTGLTLRHGQWRTNRCRRTPGPAGVGHWWRIYSAHVIGTLAPSARETRNARWLAPADLQQLAERTMAYAAGWVADQEWQASPGIEPVWVEWLSMAGLITLPHPMELIAIDRAATVGGPAFTWKPLPPCDDEEG